MNAKFADPAKAFLGVGWSYPVQADVLEHDVAQAEYEEDIRQSKS